MPEVVGAAGEEDRIKVTGPSLIKQTSIKAPKTPFLRVTDNNNLNPSTRIYRFKKIIQYINEKISEPITLTELSELADLNPAYFSTLFTKHMGIPPLRYVNNKKIEKAQTLLLSITKTLEEISRMVGYDDVFYFSRIFKKITGLTPAKYRKQILH